MRAISAACLAAAALTLAACGPNKEIIARAVKVPLPSPALTAKLPRPHCYSDAKQDRVSDIEKQRDCFEQAEARARKKHSALADSVGDTRRAVKKLSKTGQL